MTRSEGARGNIVALDVSVRRARQPMGPSRKGATILFFTGVRYQRQTGDAQILPPQGRPAGADEHRVEG